MSIKRYLIDLKWESALLLNLASLVFEGIHISVPWNTLWQMCEIMM